MLTPLHEARKFVIHNLNSDKRKPQPSKGDNKKSELAMEH